MPMLVQCPNPACKASCSVAEPVSDHPFKCPKCLKPFVVKPTADWQKGDTNHGKPSSNANPFPVLPAEFGRYRILRLLGRGGMGAVYLAKDSQLGRQVALKVPFFDVSESPQRAERFVREGRSAAVLQHPNICTVFDAGQINGRPFITMTYIAGKPLEEEIDPETPMPQLRAAEIVRKIAVALEQAHRTGIVHRDLKPANVMMAAGGEPVVMDFGLAKRVVDVDPNEAKLTRDGGLLGTPSYMAPEQCKGDVAAIGPATDVYCARRDAVRDAHRENAVHRRDERRDWPDPDRPGAAGQGVPPRRGFPAGRHLPQGHGEGACRAILEHGGVCGGPRCVFESPVGIASAASGSSG